MHSQEKLVRRMTVLVTLYLVIAELLVAQQPVALRGVTVLDGTGAAPLRNAVVIIQSDRITAVGTAGQVPIPSGASVRDLPGKFLLPGFIDMHAHIAFGPVSMTGEGAQAQLRMDYDDAASVELSRRLLEYGVTTIRNPAGPLPQAVLLRDRIARGEIPGPRTFTAGEVIDFSTSPGLGVAARNDSAIRAIVRAQIAAGVNYVKLYAGLVPALVTAGIDEAHQHGKKVIAHTMLTSWTEATRAGIDGIVHIVPGNPRLLPPESRAAYLKSITGTQFMYTWFQFVDLKAPEIDTMVAALTQRRVVVDPTLVTFEAMFRGNDTAITRSPDLVTAPASLLRNWQSFQLSKGWSEADFVAAQKVWPTVLAFTKMLHDRGVTLVVGTDTPNPWAAPGTSYHRELELLVSAGIPPATVVQMATRRGAEALGIDAETGTIAPGKLADLVLLDADPLASIRNTRRIVWVMQGGRIVHERRP